MIDMSKEIFCVKEPIHVCKCGEFIYSRDDLYLIEIKNKPLDERYKKVCKNCYLKHKEGDA